MFGKCLESVWKVYGKCLENVWKVSVWKVSHNTLVFQKARFQRPPVSASSPCPAGGAGAGRKVCLASALAPARAGSAKSDESSGGKCGSTNLAARARPPARAQGLSDSDAAIMCPRVPYLSSRTGPRTWRARPPARVCVRACACLRACVRVFACVRARACACARA